MADFPVYLERLFGGLKRLRWLGRSKQSPLPGGVTPNTPGTDPVYQWFQRQLETSYDRQARYQEYEQMDRESTESCVALNYYADDATQTDRHTGKKVWVESPFPEIVAVGTDLFDLRLELNATAWSDARGLAKRGDRFKQFMIDKEHPEKGILGCKMFPANSIRRIDDDRANLLGFRYDPYLGYTAYNGNNLKDPKKDVNTFYNPWDFVHFRILGDEEDPKGAQYGKSMLEAARPIYKRLKMLEEMILLTRACLRGDSRVWTDSGFKFIKDLVVGDRVYTMGTDEKLVLTPVVYSKCTGRDLIYEIRSRHRTLHANATHPVLVEEKINGARVVHYVEVKDLRPKVHRFVTPEVDDGCVDLPRLKFPEVEERAKLRSRVERQISTYVGNNLGMGTSSRVREFFDGLRSLPAGTARKAVLANGNDPNECLDVYSDWGPRLRPNFPEVPTEDFARWFGFMIGDGSVSVRDYKQGDYTLTQAAVMFSEGANEDTNRKYADLFSRFVGYQVRRYPDKNKKLGRGAFGLRSQALAAFLVMNGYIPGAHNKRVPDWVFQCPRSIKLAFLEGLADADGYWRTTRAGDRAFDLGLCNKALVEDVRTLAMQCGLTVTRVHSDVVKGGHVVRGKTFKDSARHSVSVTFKQQPISELILSVTPLEEDSIYDIGVEAESHNFVADGVVVHNTRGVSRLIYYVDVGDMPPERAIETIRMWRRVYKRDSFLDPSTGAFSPTWNPIALDQDIFWPMREGVNSKIDQLQGNVDVNGIADLEYFQDKMFLAIAVPREYLSGQGSAVIQIGGGMSLAQKDIRYARTVARLQSALIEGYTRALEIHLALLGMDPDRSRFQVKMATISNLDEMQRLDALAGKINTGTQLAMLLQNLGCDPGAAREHVLREILGFADDTVLRLTPAPQPLVPDPGAPAPPPGGGPDPSAPPQESALPKDYESLLQEMKSYPEFTEQLQEVFITKEGTPTCSQPLPNQGWEAPPVEILEEFDAMLATAASAAASLYVKNDVSLHPLDDEAAETMSSLPEG